MSCMPVFASHAYMQCTESLGGVVRGVVTTKMVVTTQGGVVTTLARGL
jgi:hypothetical protein